MENVRSFIAIELSADILRQVSRLQERIKGDMPPGLVRWTRPEGIHLTLKFLGDVQAERLEDIAATLRSACAPYAPFALSVGGMGVFPNPRRPRVVWIGVDEPTGTLTRLQRDVEHAIAPLGFPTERRRFSPHLTLGRVKRGRSVAELEALGQYADQARVWVGEMGVQAVYLMRSDLRPSGAVYTELAEVSLSSKPAPPAR
jgi:2'-5' RNA ligase